MDPMTILASILAFFTVGGGSIVIKRLLDENKQLRADADKLEADRDKYFGLYVKEREDHAETRSAISGLKGELEAQSKQIQRMSAEIQRLSDELAIQGGGHS